MPGHYDGQKESMENKLKSYSIGKGGLIDRVISDGMAR